MENNELLQAMQTMIQENNRALGQMMDEKLEANNKSLRFEMGQMMEEKLEPVKAEIGRVEHELTILIEDNHKDIANLLREDYGRIEGNAAKGAEVAESYEEVKSTQSDHTRAIQQHHERITVLEEKAI